MTEKRQHKRSTEEGSDTGSERFCAVTRVCRDPKDLIRFVLSPDGVVVPDLDRKLPGRGVWVTAARKIVDEAVAKRLFAKSLKAKADAPADLGASVEALIVKRVGATLSLANKAGLAIAGFEKIFAALDKGPIAALAHGSDAAIDGRSKIDRKYQAIQRSQGKTAPIVDVLTIAQMSLAIGRGSVVHAALIPGGLADRFLEDAERLSRYRASAAEAVEHHRECIAEG